MSICKLLLYVQVNTQLFEGFTIKLIKYQGVPKSEV